MESYELIVTMFYNEP